MAYDPILLYSNWSHFYETSGATPFTGRTGRVASILTSLPCAASHVGLHMLRSPGHVTLLVTIKNTYAWVAPR